MKKENFVRYILALVVAADWVRAFRGPSYQFRKLSETSYRARYVDTMELPVANPSEIWRVVLRDT
jgi:hypothetical protein